MPNRRMFLSVASSCFAMAVVVLLGSPIAHGQSKKAKYYFKINEVNVGKHGDAQIAKIAREGLEKELQSRPEFTSDLGGITDDAAVLAELKKRGLKGFKAS